MTGSAPDPRGDRAATEPPPGLPRWVKLLGLGVLVVVVIVVVVMLLLGDDHGPGMHRG